MSYLLIISGGSRGLGKAIVDNVLNYTDARIIVISRSLIPQENKIFNDRIIHIGVDLSALNSFDFDFYCKNLVKKDTFVYFINNAAVIEPINCVGHFNDDEIISSVNVNVLSPVLIVNSLMKSFSDNIALINIGSKAATKLVEKWSLYCSTKSFTKMFFSIVKEENKENKSINVYDIDPGAMDTEMQAIIRINNFPNVEKFIELKKNNALFSPNIIALKILSEINFANKDWSSF